MTNPQHEALVEAVARAICSANGADPDRDTTGADASDKNFSPEWLYYMPDAEAAIAALSATAATPSDEDVRLKSDMAWFSGQRRLSLTFYSPMYGDDDDQSEEWRVEKESGPINDREWDVVGRGQTASQAISAARAALEPQGKDV